MSNLTENDLKQYQANLAKAKDKAQAKALTAKPKINDIKAGDIITFDKGNLNIIDKEYKVKDIIKGDGSNPRTEHQIQSSLFQMINQYAAVDPTMNCIFAVPNGGKRSIGVAVKMKSEGCRPGVWDIMIPVSVNGHPYAVIEMKRPGGKLSTEQKWWLENVYKPENVATGVFDNEGDAMKFIIDYLNGVI